MKTDGEVFGKFSAYILLSKANEEKTILRKKKKMDEQLRIAFGKNFKPKNKRHTNSFSIFIPSLLVTAIFFCQLLVTNVQCNSAKDM